MHQPVLVESTVLPQCPIHYTSKPSLDGFEVDIPSDVALVEQGNDLVAFFETGDP